MQTRSKLALSIIFLSALLIISTALGIDEYTEQERKHKNPKKAYMVVQTVLLSLAIATLCGSLYMFFMSIPASVVVPKVTMLPLAMGGIGKPSGHPLHAMMF